MIFIGIAIGVATVFTCCLALAVVGDHLDKSRAQKRVNDPGLDVALHLIRRQRELDELKLETRMAARRMRRDGLRQMHLVDEQEDTP